MIQPSVSAPRFGRHRLAAAAAATIVLGATGAIAAPSGGDADLGQYRNKNRLLIICAPSSDDSRFVQQDARLRGAADGLKERDVVRFDLLESGVSRRGSVELGRTAAETLRRRLRIVHGQFKLIVIDKDGRTVVAATRSMPRADVFAAIDATPLRRYEARTRKKASPVVAKPGRQDILPNRKLSPEQVVKIQMEALQHNDVPTPDAGIAKTFDFASPQNKQATGPLDHFALIVKGAAYLPMLNCKSVSFDPIEIDGGRAAQRVHIVAADGTRITYVFELSLQSEGEFEGCWMNDGCIREDTEPDPHRLDA